MKKILKEKTSICTVHSSIKKVSHRKSSMISWTNTVALVVQGAFHQKSSEVQIGSCEECTKRCLIKCTMFYILNYACKCSFEWIAWKLYPSHNLTLTNSWDMTNQSEDKYKMRSRWITTRYSHYFTLSYNDKNHNSVSTLNILIQCKEVLIRHQYTEWRKKYSTVLHYYWA